MIDPRIRILIEELTQRTMLLTRRYPILGLDLTWPSIGTIDLLLRPLRGQVHYGDSEDRLIMHAAAYLGVFAYHSLKRSTDNLDVSLLAMEQPNNEILLEIRGGEMLPASQVFRIPITSLIRSVIRSCGKDIKAIGNERLTLHPNSNFLSTAALGIVIGPSGYGQGAWGSLNLDQAAPFAASTLPFLSTSCAAYYSRCFPAETIGQEAELYERDLIFPPLNLLEAHPGLNGARGIVSFAFADREKLDPEDLNYYSPLLRNLLFSPDELISVAALNVCLATGLFPEISRTALESKNHLLPGLRVSAQSMAHQLHIEDDWIFHLEHRNFSQAARRALYEQRLGLLPLLGMPVTDFFDPVYLPFLKSIAKGSLTQGGIEESLAESDLLIGKVRNPALHLARIHLELLRDGLDRAGAELHHLAHLAADPEHPLRVDYLYFSALVQSRTGNKTPALSTLIEAQGLAEADTERRSQILRERARLLLHIGDINGSCIAAQQAVVDDSLSIDGQLLLHDSLLFSERTEEAQNQLDKLAAHSVTNPKVFERISCLAW